ncbi:MAG: peptidoglycan bridge formation glycyltransferase FemA/FemB family protein [Candidatus Magasanikbacteria bacterium]|jgi:peptidoglycan pentaglycine glycine transferase (the first glycine)|nr:peptidoglycan bridge formation glycyltransferase FemA/FemB family protein [Candidatus Magasanikbacteria bacterium]
MKTEAKIITNAATWDTFYKTQPYTLFTQSSTNTAVYNDIGEPSVIMGLFSGDQIVGGAVAVGVHAKRGSFLLLPYGPVVTSEKDMHILFDALHAHAKQEGYVHIKISPFKEQGTDTEKWMKAVGMKQAPLHILAEDTWLLDISLSEEELLKGMKKNHRNLVRRCERDGVEINMLTDDEALSRLNDMHDEIGKRHNFVRFPRSFVDAEFKAFAEKGEAIIFEAVLPDGRIDGSAIIIFYGNMACYRHSASMQLDKRLPSAYLIQWRAIQEAKKRGMKWYNFWGIAPEGASASHPFYGITHFKKGFGGSYLKLIHCHDLIISPLRYRLSSLIDLYRKLRRGF